MKIMEMARNGRPLLKVIREKQPEFIRTYKISIAFTTSGATLFFLIMQAHVHIHACATFYMSEVSAYLLLN